MRQRLILLLAVVAYACGQAPTDATAPDGPAAFKKGGNGGGPPSDISVDVEIYDALGLLHGDGGLYVDGGDVVAVVRGRSGNFWLDLYESARTYHVHLADGDIDGVCGSVDAAGLPIDCRAEGDVGYGRLSTFSSPEGGLLALAPGQTEEEYFGLVAIGMPIGRLTWGDGCDNHPVPDDFVDVSAFDDDADGNADRWTIEAPPNSESGNAVLCRRGRIGKGKQPPAYEVGRFNLPLKLTLKRLP